MPDRFDTLPDANGAANVVAIAKGRCAGYGDVDPHLDAPELPSGGIFTVAGVAVRELFCVWRLDSENYGSERWNPLGTWIRPGATVAIKPNWVLHYNKSGEGMDCLVTHTSIIEAVLEYVILARPGSIVIGDAPLQGCNFDQLLAKCGIDRLVDRFGASGVPMHIQDFRRTVLHGERIGAARSEDRHALENYVLFDLGKRSLLEAISGDAGRFRVTMYDPDRMRDTHGPGKHQYLIAKPVIDADVVVNLPKLKCHKKAGITGALKNLVGINGNKEFLPHHRKGGAGKGDCYAGGSRFKALAEDLLDAANRSPSRGRQSLLNAIAQKAVRLANVFGDDTNLEGAWYGNDTVWRMCLDLQRILRYGKVDGSLAPVPQRSVISITDAIIAGEGEGPLAPTPVPAGLVTGAANPAAAEWVHARLMGFDPARIPLVSHAFGDFEAPLAGFPAEAIRVLTQDGEIMENAVEPILPRGFRPPDGWKGHCEST